MTNMDFVTLPTCGQRPPKSRHDTTPRPTPTITPLYPTPDRPRSELHEQGRDGRGKGEHMLQSASLPGRLEHTATSSGMASANSGARAKSPRSPLCHTKLDQHLVLCLCIMRSSGASRSPRLASGSALGQQSRAPTRLARATCHNLTPKYALVCNQLRANVPSKPSRIRQHYCHGED